MTIYIEENVYDALELVAEMMNGVGAGAWFEPKQGVAYPINEEPDLNRPVCINGFGCFLGLTKDPKPLAIPEIGIHTNENDVAVYGLHDIGIGHMDKYGTVRVPFSAYVEKLDVVRGRK
jgi:hypothetical protein